MLNIWAKRIKVSKIKVKRSGKFKELIIKIYVSFSEI